MYLELLTYFPSPALQFGLSLLYLVLSRGEELQSSDSVSEITQDNQWWVSAAHLYLIYRLLKHRILCVF